MGRDLRWATTGRVIQKQNVQYIDDIWLEVEDEQQW